MAFNRAERIGTIFSRITSLIRGGTMKEQDIPLWYVVYKTFPPKHEPRYDRPPSTKPIKTIYYEEDLIRAKFHKDVKMLPKINLRSTKKSPTQTFLDFYTEYQKTGQNETEAYNKAMQKFESLLSAKSNTRKLRDSNVSEAKT